VGGVAHVLAQWECSDGGSLSMDSNGTVTYFPQSGGDGPGTTGGGGCTTPTPGDTNPDGSPVQDEVRGIGYACDTVVLPPCDPLVPACWDTLGSNDLAAIEAGLDRSRDSAWFTALGLLDQGLMCDSVSRRARQLLVEGRVYRGNISVPDGPHRHNATTIESPEGSGNWKVHIDGDW
jgi:hypothetical protein